MPDKKKIRLHLLTDLFSRESKYEIINTHDYCEDDPNFPPYHCPTLKDVAIILYECVGHGVQWQLSRELSTRLNTPFNTIDDAISDIVSEYADMSDEKALALWDEGEFSPFYKEEENDDAKT